MPVRGLRQLLSGGDLGAHPSLAQGAFETSSSLLFRSPPKTPLSTLVLYQSLEKVCTVQEGRLRPDDIDEDRFVQHLWTADIPDPDLLIRTGKEMRISNFLLWQLAYTELFVTDTLWPDFDREHFLQALVEYQSRQRRFGRTAEQQAATGFKRALG